MKILSYRKTEAALLALAAAIIIGGYLSFRYAFDESSGVPFAQEVLLVFMGASVTIIITAILLNRQTELELRKEGKVLIFNQKSDTYLQMIEKVAELVENRTFDDTLVHELRVLNHKLAIIGSASVIKSFNQILHRLLAGLRDGTLSEKDAEDIMHEVAEVSVEMRRDLLVDSQQYASDEIRNAILSNSRGVEKIDNLEDKFKENNL